MTDLQKQLRQARPKLKVVSPLAYWIMLSLATFNVVFGSVLFLALDQNRLSAPLLIVNEVFTYQFWGLIFIGLGLLKFFSLWANNWNLARNTLLMGVTVKITWAVALAIRTFVSPGTFLVNLVWITLALIQMGTYIWFLPPAIGGNTKQRRDDRD